MRRSLFGLAALLGAVALSLASGHAALAADAMVAMSGFQFVPASVTVNVGDSVTWRNDDGVPHSARAEDGSFDTGVFGDGSRSVTLTQPGTFGYFCAVHTTMRGTVNVVAAATAPPPTTAPPTARPTAAPPTVAPATPTVVAVTPTPAPAATPTPSPTEATTATAPATPSPSPVAVQASPTPLGSSQPRDGDAAPLVAAAIAAGVALTGVAFWLIRRR